MKRSLLLGFLALAIGACTSTGKNTSVSSAHTSGEAVWGKRTVAEEPSTKAVRKPTKDIVRKVVGKYMVDVNKCSLKVQSGDRVMISVTGKGASRGLSLVRYRFDAEGILDTDRYLIMDFRFGKGNARFGGGYGGTEYWNSALTENSISATTEIRQVRDGKPERPYFQRSSSLEIVGEGRVAYNFKEDEVEHRCEFVRVDRAEAFYRPARKLLGADVKALYASAASFDQDTDLDQMAFELGKARYVKDGQLTANEIQELMMFQIATNMTSVVPTLITSKAQATKAVNESLNKLIAYGRESGEDQSSYAPLNQIKVQTKALLHRGIRDGRAFYINWGAGGDSMGDGILVIDEKTKEAVYLGNGDYI
ncbi:MAG: hypothetical protein V4692_01395 [Bdellovibrionota bacterium]